MGFALIFVEEEMPLWLGCSLTFASRFLPCSQQRGAGQIGTWLRWFQCHALDLCPGCHSSGRQGPQTSRRVLAPAFGPAGCEGHWLIPDCQQLGVHLKSDVYLAFLCPSGS